MRDHRRNSSAELLLGIARAQAGIIQGLENEMAGVRSGRIIPALQNVAHLRDHPNPTLTDLPVRVLLGTLGRAVPTPPRIVRDLERLFGAARLRRRRRAARRLPRQRRASTSASRPEKSF